MLLLSDYIARLEEGVIRTTDLLSGELSDAERARLTRALDRIGTQLVAARVTFDGLGDIHVSLHDGAKEALGYAPRPQKIPGCTVPETDADRCERDYGYSGGRFRHAVARERLHEVEDQEPVRGSLEDRYATYVECAPPGELLSFDEWLCQ